MGRKILIMPPYRPVEYHGDMGREIERRSDMYRDMEMRAAPYRGSGGYNDRAGVMNYNDGMMRMGGYDDMRGGYGNDMRMGGAYYNDYRYEDGYAPEMRRGRDSRGRYTSVRSEYEPEMNRRRREDGTYMSMGGYDEPEMTGGRYMPSYVPPIYERQREETVPKMHKIGFAVEGEMERLPREARTDYRSDASYMPMNEMEHKNGERMSGYGSGSEYMPMTKQMAMEWAKKLENEDGSRGPHWTMEQTNTVMAQKHIEADPIEFFLAMNLTYSDLSKEFQKNGINKIDAYVDFAKAFWLCDKDVPDKLSRYYAYLVQ